MLVLDRADKIDWEAGHYSAKALILRLLGVSGTSYEDVPEEEIVRRLKEIEKYELEELDPVKEWEMKHLYT